MENVNNFSFFKSAAENYMAFIFIVTPMFYYTFYFQITACTRILFLFNHQSQMEKYVFFYKHFFVLFGLCVFSFCHGFYWLSRICGDKQKWGRYILLWTYDTYLIWKHDKYRGVNKKLNKLHAMPYIQFSSFPLGEKFKW